MKKIMLNDKFGLTKAVLKGRKTMTRRMVIVPRTFNGVEVCGWVVARNAVGECYTYLTDEEGMHIDDSFLKPHYKIGEEVAVAQSYKDVFSCEHLTPEQENQVIKELEKRSAGCTNKMFVKAELMPHRIRITNVSLQRLQDISEDDFLKEGGVRRYNSYIHHNHIYNFTSDRFLYNVGRREWFFRDYKECFGIVIDKITGKGTWENNPYVFVYEFELVRQEERK